MEKIKAYIFNSFEQVVIFSILVSIVLIHYNRVSIFPRECATAMEFTHEGVDNSKAAALLRDIEKGKASSLSDQEKKIIDTPAEKGTF